MKKILVLGVAGLIIGLNAASAIAAGKSYIVSVTDWGQAQESAVRFAGGNIIFSHSESGLVIVESDVPEFAARLMASGLVKQVDEDVIIQQEPVHEVLMEESSTVNSYDTGVFYPLQWAPQAVEAPAAWAAGYTGRGVRLAIVDGGIHSTHIDLEPNLDKEASRSFVPGFAWNQDVGSFWHGTHVAGIVAAAGIGTVGIAPEATLISVKVLHDNRGPAGQAIAGILYAATPVNQGGAGADIINLSLGYDRFRGGGNTGVGQLLAAFNKAINYAHRQGVLVVATAGNRSIDFDHAGSLIHLPAESSSVVVVSATSPNGFGFHEAVAVFDYFGNPISVTSPTDATNYRRIASYTNYGNSLVDLAAPGGDADSTYFNYQYCRKAAWEINITRFCYVFDLVLSTIRGVGAGSQYGWAGGTSMAAPAVSGVAALVKQANPGISPGALKSKLQRSADDEGKKGNDPFYGKGFVNAWKATSR